MQNFFAYASLILSPTKLCIAKNNLKTYFFSFLLPFYLIYFVLCALNSFLYKKHVIEITEAQVLVYVFCLVLSTSIRFVKKHCMPFISQHFHVFHLFSVGVTSCG